MSDAPRPTAPGDFTHLLRQAERGDADAAAQILPLVYQELCKLAAAKMAREPAGLTLQPTALVHEAWLRLGGDQQPDWQNRAQFFSAAAEAMRRILIDNARRRRAVRHGGALQKVSADDEILGIASPDSRVMSNPRPTAQAATNANAGMSHARPAGRAASRASA
jgi:RNA polymerase sigma factor (TIGR02999 family)